MDNIEKKLDTIIDMLQTLIEQNMIRIGSNAPGYPTPDTKFLEKKIWWDNEERLEKIKHEIGDWPPGPSITCKDEYQIINNIL